MSSVGWVWVRPRPLISCDKPQSAVHPKSSNHPGLYFVYYPWMVSFAMHHISRLLARNWGVGMRMVVLMGSDEEDEF